LWDERQRGLDLEGRGGDEDSPKRDEKWIIRKFAKVCRTIRRRSLHERNDDEEAVLRRDAESSEFWRGYSMLLVISALKGYAVEASDGRIGTVSDFLFDDVTWKLRWLVVDIGSWLTGHKVMIHPSAIAGADYEREVLPLRLTKAQVEGSLNILQDPPVSRQIESDLYGYYGWDPLWPRGGYFGENAMAFPLVSPPFLGGASLSEATAVMPRSIDADPHLRSTAEIKSYHVHATDGEIGHVENLIVDDIAWEIRYLIVDTRNWWPGKHVLMSPYAVREINWAERYVRLDLGRDKVKASPPWDPMDMIDQVSERRLHRHYGWAGYGW
jgi:hypothetical protein